MWNSGRIGNRPCLPAPVVGAPPAAPAWLGVQFQFPAESATLVRQFSHSGRIGNPCAPIFNFRQNRQCPSLAPYPSVSLRALRGAIPSSGRESATDLRIPAESATGDTAPVNFRQNRQPRSRQNPPPILEFRQNRQPPPPTYCVFRQNRQPPPSAAPHPRISVGALPAAPALAARM